MKRTKSFFLIFILLSLFTFSCSDKSKDSAVKRPIQIYNPNPADNTPSVSTIVNLSWECFDPENDPLTFDVYFGTSSNPVLVKSNQSKTIFNPGLLKENTTYFWMITARDNKKNSTTSNIWKFTTEVGEKTGVVGTGTVTDIDGNVYQTLVIGNYSGKQEWMIENLKVTHYRNGDPIQNVKDNDQWVGLNSGAYCFYDNDPTKGSPYGALYNWYAVNDERVLSPEGWHIPTDEELKKLEITLGMNQEHANDTGPRGSNEGSKLAGGYDLWNSGSLRNNPEFGSSGFSLLPGGFRYYLDGRFGGMGKTGNLWSATEVNTANGWTRGCTFDNSNPHYINGPKVYRNNTTPKQSGLSVRCVRD